MGRNNARFITISTLAVSLIVLVAVDSAEADPEESQRLRGLGDRVFLVEVDFLVDGNYILSFPNCYFFTSDLNVGGYTIWLEAAQPDALGTWNQHSTGANTGYFATADLPASVFGFPTTLLQNGHVSPALGQGVLQLEAISTIQQFGDFLTFVSVGSEIDEAEVDTLCPQVE